jgi:hypothetical protein
MKFCKEEVVVTLNDLVAKYGLEKINSITKYPSILTYHQLGSKGGLKDELIEERFPSNVKLYITEKVDGTNGRIVYLNGDYLIGQREMFVYAKGDRIINSDIVDVMTPYATDLDESEDLFTVMYGEVYGYKIQDGSKVYCPDGNTDRGFRVFDVWQMPVVELDEYLSKATMEQIVYDREHNWQPWLDVDAFERFVVLKMFDVTPRRKIIDSSEMPISAVDTKRWLEDNFQDSHATFDGTSSNQKFGRAEGVVIRTADRSIIRKLRFEDYHKGEMKGWK